MVTDKQRLDFLQKTKSLVNRNPEGSHLAYYGYRDVIDKAISHPSGERQKIVITKEALQDAGEHNDCSQCLLATALLQRGFKGVVCTHEGVVTSLGKFRFSAADAKKLRGAYPQSPVPKFLKRVYPTGFRPTPGKGPLKSAKPFTITLVPV